MTTILIMSLFWILYGVLGLFGIQMIPAKYRGHDWTKDYIRYRGISWILLGVPYLAISLFAYGDPLPIILMILGSAVPSLVYTIVKEKQYKTLFLASQET